MHAVARYADYDGFAWFYNKYWGNRCCEQVLPIVEQLVLPGVPEGARILDLCCGTGQVAQALIEREYRVTGIDGSGEMIRYACENAPAGRFLVADARYFSLPEQFDAVICTSDSLNHVMSLDELQCVFQNVYSVLDSGGVFLFDLNREEGYRIRAGTTTSVIRPDHVCVVRAEYCPSEKVGKFDITTFRMDRRWERYDLTLLQRCYPQAAVKGALKDAGFRHIRTYDMQRDLGIPVQLPTTVFLCSKPKDRRSLPLPVCRPGVLVAMYPGM